MSRTSPRKGSRRLSIVMRREEAAEQTKANMIVQQERDAIRGAQEQLLRKPDFSDLTIVCGGRNWKCQRAILSQRCSFFHAVCTGQYEESATRYVNLRDDDADAVDVILIYLYTLAAPMFDHETPLNLVASVLKVADKYGIAPLFDSAKAYLMDVMHTRLSNWHLQNAESKEQLLEWLRTLWRSHVGGIDDLQAASISALVRTSKSIVDDESFQDLLLENRELNFAIIRAMAMKSKGK